MRASKNEKGHHRPLRVLIVAPSMDILGGQAVQAARLLEQWRRESSLEVSFLPINPRLPGPLRRLQAVKYVRTVLTSLVYGATLLARLPAYDIIHIFSASYLSFVLAQTPAILTAKLYGKKIILNYRSGEAEDHLRRWRRTAIPTIRLADRLAVPSAYLVEVFAKFGLRARPVFNIVDDERFRFRDRRPLRPRFLSNRNFEPLYNVACTLRAFALIQRRYPEARLTVAGDGSERETLMQLSRQLGLRNTEFVGRVAPERMADLYDAADIYLNSPNIDNMPGSVVEALTAGLPVVSTEAGGIPYIVADGRTGLLVGLNDHEAMAERAIRLLEDAELASRIIHEAQKDSLKYRWEAVKDDWLELYRELEAGRKAMPESVTGGAVAGEH